MRQQSLRRRAELPGGSSTTREPHRGRSKAREIFKKYAERYHRIARQGIEGILSRA